MRDFFKAEKHEPVIYDRPELSTIFPKLINAKKKKFEGDLVPGRFEKFLFFMVFFDCLFQ